jgi:hypothetical protein
MFSPLQFSGPGSWEVGARARDPTAAQSTMPDKTPSKSVAEPIPEAETPQPQPEPELESGYSPQNAGYGNSPSQKLDLAVEAPSPGHRPYATHKLSDSLEHSMDCGTAAHTVQAKARTAPDNGGVPQKTYTIAVWTGEIDDDDRKQWWYLPSDRGEWTKKYEALKKSRLMEYGVQESEARVAKGLDLMDNPLPLSSKFASTSEHTCGPVYVQLIGEKTKPGPTETDGRLGEETVEKVLSKPQKLANSEDPSKIFVPGDVDEFAVTCGELGDIVGVEFFIGDPKIDGADYVPGDWNDKRWKVEKVAVTCVQHDTGSGGGCCGSMFRKKKGEFAGESGLAGNNLQWHFVCSPDKKWVGKLPPVPDKLHIERTKRHNQKDRDWAASLCCASR